MDDKMFRHVVEPFVNTGGKRKYTLLLSIVAHTLVITAAIIVPLVATDTLVLPTHIMMSAFSIRPPLPPSPPQPRGVRREVAVTKLPIPLEAPQAIAPEIPIQSDAPIAVEHTPGLVDGGDYSAPPPTPASPRPVADVPVRPSSGIKPPVKVKDVAPLYPAIARAAHVEGVVIIEATIGPDGKVRDARILRSIQLLDAAALDAVRQWEYNPTLLNGAPVSVVMTVTVNFRLR